MDDMERTDEVLVRNMIKIMILYGIVIQIICLIMPGNHLKMTIGLWIGVIAGILMLKDMRATLNEALDLDAGSAQKYMQKRYAIRYGAVVMGFIALTYLDIVNFLTLFAGIMGLKVSAYLQPLTHEIFQKFQKS